MPFPILFGTTITTVLHYRADCDVHRDFLACGSSAVNVPDKILLGRPYGGMAILYRKNLADRISIIDCNDSRLTAVKLFTQIGPVLILNVYMPTNYQDDDSVDRYMETCGKINALITDCDIAEIIIIGDFNCSAGSRMYTSFNDLMEANKLVYGDIKVV